MTTIVPFGTDAEPHDYMAIAAMHLAVADQFTLAWEVIAEMVREHGAATAMPALLMWIDMLQAIVCPETAGAHVNLIPLRVGLDADPHPPPPKVVQAMRLISARFGDNEDEFKAVIDEVNHDDKEWSTLLATALEVIAVNIRLGAAGEHPGAQRRNLN